MSIIYLIFFQSKEVEESRIDDSVSEVVAENSEEVSSEAKDAEDGTTMEDVSELQLEDEDPRRRNLVPDGSSETLDKDNEEFEQPVFSQEPSEIERDANRNSLIRSDVEQKSYSPILKRKVMEDYDDGLSEHDGENTGNGKKLDNLSTLASQTLPFPFTSLCNPSLKEKQKIVDQFRNPISGFLFVKYHYFLTW